MAKEEKTEEIQKPRIRIKLKAFDNKIIDQSSQKIVDTVLRHGSEVIGPVPLPTKIVKFTVNRSTFVHKDARNQYEMRTHKRLIDIPEPTARVIDSLGNLDLPSGVNIEIKM